MATAAELMEWIDTAIRDILENGQHVAMGDRVYTKADLRDLREMRKEYAAEAKMTKTSSILTRTRIGVPKRDCT